MLRGASPLPFWPVVVVALHDLPSVLPQGQGQDLSLIVFFNSDSSTVIGKKDAKSAKNLTFWEPPIYEKYG